MNRKTENGSSSIRTMQRRMRFLSIFLPMLLIVPAARAFQLQVLSRDMLRARAARQSNLQIRVPSIRGVILDRSDHPLAVSVPVPSVFAIREQVKDRAQTAKALAKVLNADRRSLEERLGTGSGFVWLKRRIAPEEAKSVSDMDLKGIGIQSEPRRYYPNKSLAASVLGFVGVDRGLEGLEYSLEEQLKGGEGERMLVKDALGVSIVPGDQWAMEPSAGATVQLTLDRTIQHFAEQSLEAGARKAGASGGALVIMEAATGRILAMASYPGFNPNNFQDYSSTEYRNRSVNFEYEPGSTFKIVTISGALQDGVYDDKAIIFCGNGKFRVADVVINDSVPHGWLTLRGILRKSSNIGASRVGLALGSSRLEKYVRDFGFGTRNSLLLPGVRSGSVRASSRWTQVDIANISFGQGLGVTPLQMVNAFNVVATGGLLRKPYIVSRLTSSSGVVILENRPTVVRRVLSEEIARKMTSMLVSVTTSGGSGVRAAIPGYQVAGKTGTAQKFSREEGAYSRSDFVASFAGFAPADNPAITAIVVMDKPTEDIYGGVVAAPVWAEVVSKSLKYLGIEPGLPGMKDDPGLVREPKTVVASDKSERKQQPEGAVMPDLSGMTLREALDSLSGFETSIDIRGSGVVVIQAPPAGSPVGDRIKVGLQPRVKDINRTLKPSGRIAMAPGKGKNSSFPGRVL